MELWDLLDKDGNKTGKTHERSGILPEGMYHLGVDLWIINSDNKILIQKRSMQKESNPGLWAMTGGSVLSGETSIEAIKRETLEELGIEIDEKELKLITQFETNKAFIDVYLLKQDISIDDIKMQLEEVDEVRWATYDEIEELYNKNQFIKNRWEIIKGYIKLT